VLPAADRHALAQSRHKSEINRLLAANERDQDHYKRRAAEIKVREHCHVPERVGICSARRRVGCALHCGLAARQMQQCWLPVH